MYPISGNTKAASYIVDAKPIGIYDEQNPFDSSWIWNQFCEHHQGGQSIAGLTPDGQSLLVILPHVGSQVPTLLHRVIRQCDMGPR